MFERNGKLGATNHALWLRHEVKNFAGRCQGFIRDAVSAKRAGMPFLIGAMLVMALFDHWSQFKPVRSSPSLIDVNQFYLSDVSYNDRFDESPASSNRRQQARKEQACTTPQ